MYEDDDGVFLVALKKTEGQVTINFSYKDILQGIFYTQDDSGNSTGFRTAYFEVTGIVDETHFDCIPLNNIPPQRFMTLARQGNKTNPKRQGSIYLDGLNKWIRVLDGVRDDNIEQKNIKVQLGDLSDINHPTFGQLEGYGALLENAYICGRLVQRNPTTGEDWVVGAVAVQGEQVFRYKDDICEPTYITLIATEQGVSSTADNRKWQYKNGSEWIDIPNATELSYILTPNDTIWREKRTLTLRYVVADIYYDIITITKLYDGEDAYSVVIHSSNGSSFINGDIGTTLRAKVYKGGFEITDALNENLFYWCRISGNPAGDAVWNELHQGVKEVTIGDDDVYRRATFECEVNIN